MKRMTDGRLAEIERIISLLDNHQVTVQPQDGLLRQLFKALKAERKLYDNYHLRAIVDAERIRELQTEVASLTNNMPKSAIDLERENFELKAEVKEANEAALNHAIAAFTAERAQDAAEATLRAVAELPRYAATNDGLVPMERFTGQCCNAVVIRVFELEALLNEAPKP